MERTANSIAYHRRRATRLAVWQVAVAQAGPEELGWTLVDVNDHEEGIYEYKGHRAVMVAAVREDTTVGLQVMYPDGTAYCHPGSTWWEITASIDAGWKPEGESDEQSS